MNIMPEVFGSVRLHITTLKEAVKKNPSNMHITTTRGIMSQQKLLSVTTVFLLVMSGILGVEGLKCLMCGQYNEGVGSITPCLNYSEKQSHLYLKECSKKSEKYCVKYVSELSTVRDCATECAEKEIWETQTYCCKEDGCNKSTFINQSTYLIVVSLVIIFLFCSPLFQLGR